MLDVKVKAPNVISVECEVEIEVKAPVLDVGTKAPNVVSVECEVEVEVKAPNIHSVEIEAPVAAPGWFSGAVQTHAVVPVVASTEIIEQPAAAPGWFTSSSSVASTNTVHAVAIPVQTAQPNHSADPIAGVLTVQAQFRQKSIPEFDATGFIVHHDDGLKHYSDERLAHAQSMFNELDVDQNRLLEGEELIQLIEALCTDDLTKDEKEEKRTQLLARLDKDEDGVLSFEEFAQWLLSFEALHDDDDAELPNVEIVLAVEAPQSSAEEVPSVAIEAEAVEAVEVDQV